MPSIRQQSRNSTDTQDVLLKSTFTETVNFRKLGPPIGVPDSKVDSFCGGLTLAKLPAGSGLRLVYGHRTKSSDVPTVVKLLPTIRHGSMILLQSRDSD